MAIFDPKQNPHHLTNHQKIGTRDYVGGPYGCDKIGANPSIGASEQVGEIYLFFFIYTFFRELTYRSDPSTDFYAWWLKRRGLAQRCAFWGVS